MSECWKLVDSAKSIKKNPNGEIGIHDTTKSIKNNPSGEYKISRSTGLALN